MLASVARHCEQKRSIIIPEVSKNVVQRFHSPGPPCYGFNPVALLSKVTGEESVHSRFRVSRLSHADVAGRGSRIASWLGLPYVPNMPDCSWQDLGLVSVQEYIETLPTKPVSNVNQVSTSSQPHRLPSPPPVENHHCGIMPEALATTQPFACTSYPVDSALNQRQLSRTIEDDIVSSQLQLTSQMILRADTDSSWLMPPQRHMQHIKEETPFSKGRGPKAKRQGIAIWPAQSQMQLELLQLENNGDQEHLSAGGSGPMSGRMRHAYLGHQNMPVPIAGYIHDYIGNECVALAPHRPFDAFSRTEEIDDAQRVDYF